MKPKKPLPTKLNSAGKPCDTEQEKYPRRFKQSERRIVMNFAKSLPFNEGGSSELARFQVTLLENRIPAMANSANLQASKADIRKKIQTVSKPLAKAIAALANLERTCASKGANLVDRSAYLDIRWIEGVETLTILRGVHTACLEAEKWRTEQAVSKTKVSTQPIWMIARTLGLDDPRINLGAGFASVVEACYRAAGLCGETDADLTRQIKKFIAERRRKVKTPPAQSLRR